MWHVGCRPGVPQARLKLRFLADSGLTRELGACRERAGKVETCLVRPKDPTNSMLARLGEQWNSCLLQPLLGLAVVASAVAEPRADDPEELRRTIDAAIVAVPLKFMDGGEESSIKSGAARPTTGGVLHRV